MKNLGEYGEFLTFKKIVATCKRYDGYYKILRNVYLQTKNGTTEVDSILIHETGIYVFESKNYSGWIFGNYKQKEWTQAVNRNVKNHFYNPIWQNEGHIAALKTIFWKQLEVFLVHCIQRTLCLEKCSRRYSRMRHAATP